MPLLPFHLLVGAVPGCCHSVHTPKAKAGVSVSMPPPVAASQDLPVAALRGGALGVAFPEGCWVVSVPCMGSPQGSGSPEAGS